MYIIQKIPFRRSDMLKATKYLLLDITKDISWEEGSDNKVLLDHTKI